MDQKDRIAKAALAEIPEDGAILLDAGTTTKRLAELLPTDRELTVVTNSVSIAATLSTRTNLTLMLLGGRLQPHNLAAVDAWSLRVLRDTYVDVAFVGATGISVSHGLRVRDGAEATVKRAVIASARRTVLLADHTKIGAVDGVCFGALSDIDLLITDTGVDPVTAEEISAAGPQVIST
jgi:DeoR family transcriptional regulator, fructose operon transcriptional repressor